MSDVRLTATNPADSSVVPVACNDKGELLVDTSQIPTFDGNLNGDLTVSGSGSFGGTVTMNNGGLFTEGAANASNSWNVDSVGAGSQKHLVFVPSQDSADKPGVLFFKKGIGNVDSNTDVYIGGNLSSNTLAPNIKLDAGGSATFSGAVISGASGLPDQNTEGAALRSEGLFQAARTNGFDVVYQSYVVGNSVPTTVIKADGSAVFAGNVTAANVSDIKFKKNITSANPQLADVTALGSSLKNWDWKEEAPLSDKLKARRFLGLIAQEAEVICPGLTYEVGVGDDTYKAINQDILIMKLLGAVAELKQLYDAL